MRIPIALLGLAAVGSLCTPAFAGHWEQHYECEGSNTHNGAVGGPNDASSWVWPSTSTGPIDTGAMNPYDDFGVDAHEMTASGKVRAVFQWVPDYTGEAPPSTLIIKEHGFAGADMENGDRIDPFTNPPVLSAGNGLGHPSITTQDIFDGACVSEGTEITTFAVPTNGTLILPWREMSAHAAPNAAWDVDDGAWPGAAIRYSAIVDNRKVQLSRQGAPAPKLESDPTLDKIKEEWVEADGTGHGHTLASYHEYVALPPASMEEHLTLDPRDVYNAVNVVRNGNWSPTENVSYIWTPQKPAANADPGDVANQESQEGVIEAETKSYQLRSMPFSNALSNPEGWGVIPALEMIAKSPALEGWENLPSNKKGSVINYQYELTDHDDEQKRTGKYSLTLHDEWENAIPNPDISWIDGNGVTHVGQSWVIHHRALSVPRIIGPQTDKTWTFANITASLSAELKTDFQAGFKQKDWLNLSGSFESSAKLEITASMEISAPKLTITGGQDALPCIQYTVKTDHKLVDHFKTSGWDRNSARTDGKFSQKADLPVPITDIGPSWITVPTGQPIESD